MTMITKGDILGLFSHVDPNNLESELWYHVDRGKLVELLDRLSSVEPPEPAERRPFVPAAQYAAGGAAMVDAIEMLETSLNEIMSILDAHRAALAAAGWLDVNGEPVGSGRGSCDCESYEPCAGQCCGVGNCTCSTEPVRDDNA